MVMYLPAQQLISGSASITLSGPASKEISLQAQTSALKSLSIELLQWLASDAETKIDTTNVLQKISFGMFADSCRAIAKTESSFKGKELTLTYLLTTDQARTKLQDYNAMVDARALDEWHNLKNAAGRNDYRAIYSTGIKALFFACAHLGVPVADPDSANKNLTDNIRLVVQQFFDKMTVTSSGTILAGKTGLAIQNPPSITLLVDSLPFSGVMFSGRLQNGTIIFSSLTDENGKIVIDNFKVPFVPNGTLLEACPNLTALIGIAGFLDPSYLGIKLNKSQVQTFIFKITKPKYTLDYKAASVSTITMPPDFANAAHVKKYLEDSCYLQDGTKNGPTDLTISINTQVSSYTYDESEELGIKVSSEIIVNGLSLQPPRTNKQQFVFEKRYGRYLTPPYGLYFWEANGKLREAIKATIAGL
jgi:hypothetical protein